jgi:YVTN family beta-propeller protein
VTPTRTPLRLYLPLIVSNYWLPTNTATVTPTPPHTSTVTGTPTRTATATRTGTRTHTPTRTRTPTRTYTFTRTGTATRTATSTPPNTPTYTPTPIRPVVTRVITPGLNVPKALVIEHERDALYVVSRDANEVYIISLTTYLTEQRVPVGQSPFGAALLNGILYVANYDGGTVSRINTTTRARILPDISVGPGPTWIAADHVSGRVYVVQHGIGGVAVIWGDSVWQTIGIGRGAFAVAVDSVGRRAYVGRRDENTVAVINIDTDTVIGSLHLDGSPFGLTVNETNGKLYVLHGRVPQDCPARWMAVFSRTGALLADVPVGDTCDGGWLDVNASNGRVYVAATASDEVWVVGPDERVRSVLTTADGIGHAPYGLVVDAARALIYVGNRDDGTISIISDPWP